MSTRSTSALATNFQKHGWALVPDLVSPEDVEALRKAFSEASEEPRKSHQQKQDATGRQVFAIYRDLYRHDTKLRRICLDRNVGALVAELVGLGAVRLFSEAYLNKPSGGYGTPWHQDWPTQPFDRRDSINVYVALDEMSPERGGIEVVSGSHRLGPLYMPSDFTKKAGLGSLLNKEDLALLSLLAYEGDANVDGVPVRRERLKPGDALVWHGLTIHGAPPNVSGEPRRAYTRTYIGAEVRYTGMPFPLASSTDPLPDRDSCTVGEQFSGDRFPLVVA